MNETKFACFDIGNVLCWVNFDPFLNALTSYPSTAISKEDAFDFLVKTQKMHDLGLTDLKSQLADRLGIHQQLLSKEYAKLREHWDAAVIQEDMMMGLLSDLMREGTQIALLSNIGFEHAERFEQLLLDTVHGSETIIRFYSCEIGARKPTLLYYQSFLIQHPQFKGATYIDDLEPNRKMGSSLGFDSVHFSLDDLKDNDKVISNQKVKKAVDGLKSIVLA